MNAAVQADTASHVLARNKQNRELDVCLLVMNVEERLHVFVGNKQERVIRCVLAGAQTCCLAAGRVVGVALHCMQTEQTVLDHASGMMLT